MFRMDEGPIIGDLAPDFTLRDSNGDSVKLSGYRGRVNVLLAFYNGGADAYSVRWLSQLNDDYLFFRSLDTDIVAISSDNLDKTRETVRRHKIPFKVLSDPGNVAIREYRVYNDLGDGAKAAAFIIDPAGMVRYKYVGRVPVDMPPNDKLMETIRDMKVD
jgi:peroxiredoxin Q/BCP